MVDVEDVADDEDALEVDWISGSVHILWVRVGYIIVVLVTY